MSSTKMRTMLGESTAGSGADAKSEIPQARITIGMRFR
jgi:hypothetical protein